MHPIRRLLVDIDSTLYLMEPLLVRHLRDLTGIEADPERCVMWDWAEHIYGIPRPVFAEAIARSHTDAEILAAPMFEGAADTLRAWRAAGVEIHVVSHRDPRTSRATKRWLRRNGIAWDGIVLDTRCDKLAYALEHGIDLIIDDKPELLVTGLAAGLAVACVALPVNRSVRAEQGDRIVAAADWPTLRSRLEARFAFGRAAAAIAAEAHDDGARLPLDLGRSRAPGCGRRAGARARRRCARAP